MGRLIAIILPILILVVLGFGGVMTLGALKPTPEKAEPAKGGLNVFAEAITKGELKLTAEAQGEVRPKREVTVSPQISGRVSYVSPDFVDGGFIKRGHSSFASKRLTMNSPSCVPSRVSPAPNSVLAREMAESELAIQDIRDLGLDDASPLARREPQLAEARASLDGAKAQLEDAKLALNRTAVYAPFLGRVRDRNVDIGQVVSPGQSLGNIFANDVVEVSLPLSDAQMGRLGLPLAFSASSKTPGPKVTFQATVGGIKRTWVGDVVRTAAAVNSQTREINVIAELKDPYGTGADGDAPMAPGLFVTAVIEGQTIPDVFIAPRAALRGDNRLFIGNTDEGTLSIRDVEVVFSDPEGAYIASGVEIGEMAIISPVQAAFDGMKLTVLERLEDGTIKTYEPIEKDDGTLVKDDDDDEKKADLETNDNGAVQ